MADPLDLSGKAVIVTGGCRGVGRGIAERFLAAGAGVVVCCRHEPETMPRSGDSEALFVAADVREPEEIDPVIGFTAERLGRLDVLVNDAGGAPPADSATASPKFSNAIITLNLVAPLVFAQKANAVMQQQAEGGVVINIASVSGIRPSPGAAAYGAAKAGVMALTRCAAIEAAPANVRVNAVAPSLAVHEHLAKVMPQEAIDELVVREAFGRSAEPWEVANVIVFLASDYSAYMTGEVVSVSSQHP